MYTVFKVIAMAFIFKICLNDTFDLFLPDEVPDVVEWTRYKIKYGISFVLSLFYNLIADIVIRLTDILDYLKIERIHR